MKNLFLIAILFMASLSVNAQSKIEGLWITIDENNTVIEVLKQNEKYQGIRRSSDNKDYVIGEVVLDNLIKKGNKWVGKIYAPTRKAWYDVEITPQNDLLKLKISVSIFSKTIKWKKHK